MHLENHLKRPKNVGVKTYLSPDGYISIDKTIYNKRGCTLVKTYNSDKTANMSLDISRCFYISYVSYTRKRLEVTETHIKDKLALIIVVLLPC